MNKLVFLVLALCLFAGTASAGVEDRSNALQASVEGNNSYEAHFARELSTIAEDELSHGEVEVARAFMDVAEKYARKAGQKIDVLN